jgi:endonuclease/exonuclease/phosphatase family metal-dependent hydrolase
MPLPSWPVIAETGLSFYTEEEKNILRLSSKNHIDLPVLFPEGKIHLLVAHPTPPVFNGEENRNGMRNHDEILFLVDYITPGPTSDYIYDDNHEKGGLAKGNRFIILGDLNADPVDGDSYNSPIQLLLTHPRIHHQAASGKLVPSSKGSYENSLRNPRKEGDNLGNPWHDTAIWGLRVDYILPSRDLRVIQSGVFWPDSSEPLHFLINKNAASDHFLVWMDLKF